VLPFEFSIVYDSAWAPDTDAVIPSPELLDFEPAPAIWTVHEPDADSGALQIAESAGIRECSRHEARLARLEGLAKALDAVQSARVAALPAKVLVAAFYHWNDELQSELASPAPGVADNTEGVDHIARQNAVQSMAAGVYQRMIQAGLLAEDSPIATGATPRSPAPQRNGDRYFMVPDLAAGLPIAVARSEVPPLPWRSLLGAAVVLGAVMGPPLARKLRLEESWIAGPPVLWVLLGVLWWIFAPFGLLGWISVAAGVWALLGRYSRVAQA
jgi:hypothetical protein